MKEKKGNLLRDDFRSALIEKLIDVLSRTKLDNNFFLDSAAFYDLADFDKKFAKKPIGELIQSYVSDSPIMDFLFEVLSEEIQQTRKYDSNVESLPLTEIEEYRDLSSLVERLVKDFESLPRSYKLFIKLPTWGLKDVLETERFELSTALSLISPSQEFSSTFPPPIYAPRRRPKFSFFFSSKEREQRLDWEDYYIYCEIAVQGFIGIYEDTSPLKRASFLVRAFCGLCLVLQLFETGYTVYPAEDVYLKVYEKIGDKWNTKKPRLLPTEFVQGLEKLSLHESFSPYQGILKRPKMILATLKKLFSNEQENEKLLRAAQWYFDSYCGDNELFSFVKATICLELLLGEKKLSEKTGVVELLRTRCAYLIGLSQKDREQIEQDFTEIYTTRSNIVHNGKDKLTKLEKTSLYKLRRLCARVIKKEIQLTLSS